MRKQTILAAFAAMAAFAATPFTAAAQDAWPSKPVKVVVPFAAGGSTDVVARLVAEKLSSALGQQFVVDNQGGSGGMIGARSVAAAPADGYTILFGTSTMSTIGVFYKEPQVDTLKDFVPASLVSQGVTTLIVTPEIGAKTVAEFVAYAKANPGKVNFGSPGPGTASLTMEMMKHRSGIDAEVVHYQGAGPAMTGLLSNEIQAMFEPTITAKPQIDGGKAIALATTGLERSPALPDVPTLTEALGEPFDGSFYNGIFVKTGTPDAIVAKLAEAVAAAVKLPEVADKLNSLGQQPVGSTPAEFTARIEKEIPQWIEVGKAAGIEPQ